MARIRRGSTWLTLWMILTLLVPPQAFAGPFSVFKKTHPKETSPLIQMAQAIDELEHEIDGYGSVVAKQPDIWGEARWTKYRQDYERVLEKELENFRVTLSAQVSEADSAFLLSATALSAAGGGATMPAANVQQVFSDSTFPQPQFISAPSTTANPFTKVLDADGNAVEGITIEPTVYLDQLSRYVKHLNELRRINEGDDTNDFPGYALNLVRLPVSVLPGDKTREGYGAEITFTIEPEMSEALLESTFKDLVVNDILDQLSVPILKLMNADLEQKSEALSRVLKHEERLAQETACLFKYAYKKRLEYAKSASEEGISEPQTILRSAIDALEREIDRASNQLFTDGAITPESSEEYFNEVSENPDQLKLVLSFRSALRTKIDCETGGINDLLKSAKEDEAAWKADINPRPDPKISINEDEILKRYNILPETLTNNDQLTLEAVEKEYKNFVERAKVQSDSISSQIDSINTVIQDVQDVIGPVAADLTATIDAIQSPTVSSSSSNVAQLPVPPSQIACVFGRQELVDIAESIKLSMQSSSDKHHHVFDVRAVMAEELDAAYRFLKTLHARGFDAWSMYCGDQELAAAIQMLDVDPANVLMPGVVAFEVAQNISVPALPSCPTPVLENPTITSECTDCDVKVAQLRKWFTQQVGYDERGSQSRPECRAKCIKALAWAFLVDSAILNEKLNGDMKRIEADKSVQFLPGYDLTFYGPEPTPEACAVFNEYVRHRWPMHVFAIDPERQEQNVQDAFARRRETQLALALAFTNGAINGEQFNKFARRIDTEIETISLNRTVVGFSHGNETFGWRFYPRVQTPPVQGNIKAFFETAFGPHKNYDIKHRQLEPGPRELLAVIIMPSFIRHARMSSRSSWFKLTHPDRSVFTTEDSVRLGQKMNYVRRCKALCLEQDCFGRPGDARRLMTAVDQLETRLPLQDTLMQVPHENTIGGYRLFSEGVKALGPELIDFYGEPGIDTSKPTELFLVGRRFNVNSTQVIAGGKTCDVDLLSREVMRVTIPDGVNTVDDDGKKVDIHLATPYGVSSTHLRIPVVEAAEKAAGPKFGTTDTYGYVGYDHCKGIDFHMLDDQSKYDITGAGKSINPVTIVVTAVRSNGTEFTLKSTTNGAVGNVGFDGKGKAEILRAEFEAAILNYIGGESPLFEFENVVALKVTGKVGTTSIENTMLIKLGCNTAVNTLPVSACATMLPVVDMPVMQYPPSCCKCLKPKPHHVPHARSPRIPRKYSE